MNIDLEITISEDYFKREGTTIDWKKTKKPSTVPVIEAEAIQKILTCEASIFLLRRALIDGSLVDDMVSTRRDFINAYESNFNKTYNDYNGESIY